MARILTWLRSLSIRCRAALQDSSSVHYKHYFFATMSRALDGGLLQAGYGMKIYVNSDRRNMLTDDVGSHHREQFPHAIPYRANDADDGRHPAGAAAGLPCFLVLPLPTRQGGETT